MKRIYLLMILFVAFMGNAMAQRTCDMELIQYISTGYKLELKGAPNQKKYVFYYGFKNNGPDTVAHTDTMHLRTPYQSHKWYWFTSTAGTIKVGDTLIITDTVTLGPGTSASMVNNNYQWCDSIWLTPMTGTITDNKTNKANKKCTSVKLEVWKTGIDGINSEDGLAIYPNPANQEVNITRNFKGNSAGYLTITDITGKVVYKEEIRNGLTGEHTFKVDVSGMAAGLHFVKLSAGDTEVVSKLTIQ